MLKYTKGYIFYSYILKHYEEALSFENSMSLAKKTMQQAIKS